MSESVKPMQAGDQIRVADLNCPGRYLDIVCLEVQQRNWSRVGAGRYVDPVDGSDEKLFLKQYVDQSGSLHPTHFRMEQNGARLATEVLGEVIDIPSLLLQSAKHSINVFDFRQLQPIDRLLRSNPESLYRSFPDILSQMVQLLDAMKSATGTIDTADLPKKSRPFGSSKPALNFKGFDIRNIGAPTIESGLDLERLSMFDLVHPYLAPIEEASAKLLVSIGLLNWGRPLSRFVRGPNQDLLELSVPYLKEYLDRDAVMAELEVQYRFRTLEFHGRHAIERMAKRVGIMTYGRYYFRMLAHWCKQNVPVR